MSDELELLEARARVYELLDELDITSPVLRLEMTSDPVRAVRVLEHATRARGIRNPASFAIARWRSGAEPRPRARAPVGLERRELEPAAEPGPPTLDALELVWALEDEGSPIAAGMLGLLEVAIARSGGLRALLERSSFDA